MANPQNLLVVFGATGNQGGAVLRHFAKNEPMFQLRGITRNSSSSASQALIALGVEMVEADLLDLSSTQAALQGATHVFATTDSNRIIYEKLRSATDASARDRAREETKKIELQMGVVLAESLAFLTSLQRIVWSSLMSPKKWTNGRITKVTMFDAKEEIDDLLRAQAALEGKMRTLVIGFYADNARFVADLYGPQKRSDGVYELRLPMSGDFPVPIADVESDVGQWVSALFQSNEPIVLIGMSESMSWNDWVQQWASHNKVEARYSQMTAEEYEAKLPGIAEAVADEFRFVETFGFSGGHPTALVPAALEQRGIKVQQTSIKEHIARTDWSSIL